MSGNTHGTPFTVTIFGESHGPAIGCVVDGCPPGMELSEGDIGVTGTDHLQLAYRLECLNCGYVYGANRSDISLRRCPKCDGGAEGIPYWRSS